MKILKRLIPLIVVVALMLQGTQVTAEATVRDSYATGDDVGVAAGADVWPGMTVTTTSAYKLTAIQVKVYRSGSPGSVRWSFKATSGNLPTGPDLTYGDYNMGTVTTSESGEWITIDVSDIALANGVKYSITADCNNCVGANYFRWLAKNVNSYGGGTGLTSANDGVSWSTTGQGMMFKLLGEDLVPVMTTGEVTNLADTSATLNGELTDLGAETQVNCGFAYGLTGFPTYTNYSTWSLKDATGAYTADISGLSPNTTYHYAAVCLDDGLNFYFGDDQTFTTTQIVPSVTTDAASYVTNFAAVLNGNVTDFMGDDEVYAWFQYGETAAYGSSVPGVYLNATGTYSLPLAGLERDTEYHYRALAINQNGTGYGDDVTFTTTGIPTVSTLDADIVSGNQVTLNAEVLDLGGNANVTILFDFGSSSGNYDLPYYGIRDDGLTPSWIMNTTGTYHQNIYGLTQGQTYYYRAHVLGGGDNWYGVEKTVIPISQAYLNDPYAVATGASDLTIDEYGANVNLNGNIIRLGTGGVPTYWFEWQLAGVPASRSSGNQTLAIGAGVVYETAVHLATPRNYEYRIAITNGNMLSDGSGTVAYSPWMPFTTGDVPAGSVSVSTLGAQEVTTTTATIGGQLVGATANDTVWMQMEWGLDPNNLDNATIIKQSTGNSTFTWQVVGLTPNTKYYAQARGGILGGASGSGEVRSFTTKVSGTATPTPTGTPPPSSTRIGPFTLPGDWSSAGAKWILILFGMVICFCIFYPSKSLRIGAPLLVLGAGIVESWLDVWVLLLLALGAGVVIALLVRKALGWS